MNERLSDQPSPGRIIALIVIGFGFLTLGVSFMLRDWQPSSASLREFSVIPSEVNLPSPNLDLADLEGAPVSLSDYAGNVVLVNLWATWCPPCREEMPALQAFHEEYKSQGFVLAAIDQGETAQEVSPFAAELGLTFPIWLDPASSAGRAFNTVSLPSSYVIDRSGRIRLMWIGRISKENLDQYVSKIIQE